jgi:hypothetical protein
MEGKFERGKKMKGGGGIVACLYFFDCLRRHPTRTCVQAEGNARAHKRIIREILRKRQAEESRAARQAIGHQRSCWRQQEGRSKNYVKSSYQQKDIRSSHVDIAMHAR